LHPHSADWFVPVWVGLIFKNPFEKKIHQPVLETSLETILIVDHDHGFQRLTKAFLEAKGYRVITASNGNKAIEKIFSEDPQIVLLDLKVPGPPGKELLKRIKKIDKNLPVIVTDMNGDLIADDLLKLGVFESFSKPISNSDLLRIIEKTGRFLCFNEDDNAGMDSLLAKFLPFFAHEIRNPLQAIGGALTIIGRRSDLRDKTLTQSIGIIKEEVQNLTEFVQECLDVIRPPNESHWGEVNINETLLLMLNLMQLRSPVEPIKVISCLDPKLPRVYANYEEIKKVILNLLKNAFESMMNTETKELTIKTENRPDEDREWINMVFQDTGVGIKKENIPLIGTPFFTTKLKGTGLGLVICHKIIVERHHGKLILESQEGKGTTVTVKFPVAQPKGISGK